MGGRCGAGGGRRRQVAKSSVASPGNAAPARLRAVDLAADCRRARGRPRAPSMLGLAPRQVVVGRTRALLGHQRVAAALADRLRHDRLRVVDVAEQARVGRAGQHAGRACGRARGSACVVDAIDAQRALGHHLALLVDLAHAVGAGPRAVLAADALVVVDQHDAVLGALVARAGRAHRHAGRVLAVQAATWGSAPSACPGTRRPRRSARG